jgi:hypothetical protein
MKIDDIIDRFLNAIIKNRSFDLFESVLGFNAIKIVAFKFKENQ